MYLIRFEDFEVNARSGELLRRGSKIKLQNQPFQVLMLLLEARGEVVTREELRNKVWREDTFVDFDRGLNKAIHSLRRALRDQAVKPRFIETLQRRGYRFIGPLVTPESTNADNGQSRIEVLAVLPLENLSGDPAEEYFSDGITAELISTLARIGLRVISRTSSMSFKGSKKPLPMIAKELRADTILEGSVVRFEQRVRITAQLIHAAEDKLLWSGSYDREMRDVLKLQNEIAQNVAGQIRRVVRPVHGSVASVQPQAYEAWLKGNFFRDKMTPPDLVKSIEFFNRSIELDPAFAKAYGDLSQAYFFCALFGVGPGTEMFAKARVNAAKAIEFDETIAIAHNSLAAIHIFHDWDWAGAEAEARRAVELSPGEPVGHAHLADYMSIRGRHDEAIAEYDRVLELDPISRVYLGHFALLLYRARRYDESITYCLKALDIDANYANALWFMALSLEQKNEPGEAIRALEKAVRISPAPHYRALLARAYAMSDAREKAFRILGELTALSRERYVSPFDIGIIHAGLGDYVATFQCFEEAYRQRVFRLIELTLPMFDNLRPDPRWQSLVHRLSLDS